MEKMASVCLCWSASCHMYPAAGIDEVFAQEPQT